MKRCLIVDDSAVIRRVARRILESMAFRISEADDGQQALALCREDMPDLVLVDCTMPVMDGYEFVKALRAAPSGTSPKVVLCTVENDIAQIARARHLGADECLLKPFDKGHVTAKLHEIGLA